MNGIIERMLENAQEHGCLNEVMIAFPIIYGLAILYVKWKKGV